MMTSDMKKVKKMKHGAEFSKKPVKQKTIL